MFKIHLASRFKRSFKKLSPIVRADFAKKIDVFIGDPFFHSLKTHKLHGNLDSYYAFCLHGGYRVIFDFGSDNNILLVNIGRHDEYARWSK